MCISISQKVESNWGRAMGGRWLTVKKNKLLKGKYDRNEMDQINWGRCFSYFGEVKRGQN